MLTILDLNAELPQRRQDRADRPLPDPRVAVERDHRRGQRGHAGHEPHHRARVAHVDAHRGAGCRLPGRDTPERECWYINMGAVDRKFFDPGSMVKSATSGGM